MGISTKRNIQVEKPVKLIFVGGFLGSGKTTALAAIAKRLLEQGKRVGIVTNDQSDNLADTVIVRELLGELGVPIEEVVAGCFCCKFEELIDNIEKILVHKPDILMGAVSDISWHEVTQRVRKGGIDVLPCVAKTPERAKFLRFTKPYLSFPMVIVTRHDSAFISKVSGFEDGKVAVVKGYATQEYLERDYPDRQFYLAADMISPNNWRCRKSWRTSGSCCFKMKKCQHLANCWPASLTN